jgi:hypothetical protein
MAGSAIEQLTALTLARHLIDDRIAEQVAEARRTGATWAQIGEALGMNLSNAHRKYAEHVSRINNSSKRGK